jgi:hypothetical protein
MLALLASKVCDHTGIGAMACARHGCFVPTSIVDFFQGEQQKNMDYAFLQAIKFLDMDPEQGAVLMYDISCQYMVHFFDRIGTLLPPDLDVQGAIGMFHVHAHKDTCFYRYAPTFIPGLGDVAGEILESLWSNMNAISRSIRTATLAFRSEVLDDHACDSNHKKALGMRGALCHRYLQATETFAVAEDQFKKLTDVSGQTQCSEWEAEVSAAEDKRKAGDLKAMDIYAAHATTTETAEEDPVAAAPHRSALEKWMDFALAVEVKQ